MHLSQGRKEQKHGARKPRVGHSPGVTLAKIGPGLRAFQGAPKTPMSLPTANASLSLHSVFWWPCLSTSKAHLLHLGAKPEGYLLGRPHLCPPLPGVEG